ncbi:hypothetical protein BJ742DRAFT_781075 [Cladochytrium replicatum]|nr:hypothetical protein BJ742DRAFT_781075 [Cladochytrium replicatum]
MAAAVSADQTRPDPSIMIHPYEDTSDPSTDPIYPQPDFSIRRVSSSNSIYPNSNTAWTLFRPVYTSLPIPPDQPSHLRNSLLAPPVNKFDTTLKWSLSVSAEQALDPADPRLRAYSDLNPPSSLTRGSRSSFSDYASGTSRSGTPELKPLSPYSLEPGPYRVRSPSALHQHSEDLGDFALDPREPDAIEVTHVRHSDNTFSDLPLSGEVLLAFPTHAHIHRTLSTQSMKSKDQDDKSQLSIPVLPSQGTGTNKKPCSPTQRSRSLFVFSTRTARFLIHLFFAVLGFLMHLAIGPLAYLVQPLFLPLKRTTPTISRKIVGPFVDGVSSGAAFLLGSVPSIALGILVVLVLDVPFPTVLYVMWRFQGANICRPGSTVIDSVGDSGLDQPTDPKEAGEECLGAFEDTAWVMLVFSGVWLAVVGLSRWVRNRNRANLFETRTLNGDA